MSTDTIIPNQDVFTDDNILTYPGDCTDVVGQVVGPNWLGEFFVATRAEPIAQLGVDAGDSFTMRIVRTKVFFEHLTSERAGLLTSSARHDFVNYQASIKESEEKRGFQKAPSYKELNQAEQFFKRPQLWS